MERQCAANLKLQPDKCEFFCPEVAYLGYIIDKEGVRPDPKENRSSKKFSNPQKP